MIRYYDIKSFALEVSVVYKHSCTSLQTQFRLAGRSKCAVDPTRPQKLFYPQKKGPQVICPSGPESIPRALLSYLVSGFISSLTKGRSSVVSLTATKKCITKEKGED